MLLALSLEPRCPFVDTCAPEHLERLSAEPRVHRRRIENAAEILVGSRASITVGNRVLGPDRVLPTGRWPGASELCR